jgi:hypothetical protein
MAVAAINPTMFFNGIANSVPSFILVAIRFSCVNIYLFKLTG